MKCIMLLLQFNLIFMQTLKHCQGSVISIGGISIPWRINTVYADKAVFPQGFTDFPKPASECYAGQQCKIRNGRKAKNSSTGGPAFSSFTYFTL